MIATLLPPSLKARRSNERAEREEEETRRLRKEEIRDWLLVADLIVFGFKQREAALCHVFTGKLLRCSVATVIKHGDGLKGIYTEASCWCKS